MNMFVYVHFPSEKKERKRKKWKENWGKYMLCFLPSAEIKLEETIKRYLWCTNADVSRT